MEKIDNCINQSIYQNFLLEIKDNHLTFQLSFEYYPHNSIAIHGRMLLTGNLVRVYNVEARGVFCELEMVYIVATRKRSF